jgi:hypothetical protein
MSAIVAYEGNDLVRQRARRGAVSVLQFASGGVAADVRVERVDRRNHCSWYALKLAANESDVTGRLVGLRRGGGVDELGSIAAAAGSVGSARFSVTTPRTGTYLAMYLEIRSAQMLLRVEAPRPPARTTYGGLKVAGTLFVVGAAAVFAGTVSYAFAGDSNRAASAHAAASLPLPKVIAAAAPPARVQSFSARRDAMPGGRETVLASYLAVGERGTIALLDGEGTVVATAAFTRVGTVRLPVPRAYRTLPLTAQITVHRGATKAVSSIAVLPNAVAPAVAPVAAPSAAPSAMLDLPAEGVTPIDSASMGAAAGIMAIEGHAVAGRLLNLRLMAQGSPVRIELEDEAGAAITQTEVAAGATHAALPLPVAAERTTYLIALHYTRNGGEETVIRTIVAAPR